MLRDYQQQAIDEGIYQYFESNEGNPVIEVPTAGGKSWIIATLIKSMLDQWPHQRVIMLTHVKELIEQNLEKMHLVWPEAPTGVYSASIGRRDMDAPILFAGIQSVYNKTDEIDHADLIIIDECHLVNESSVGMYRRFIDSMQVINPYLKVIGFTATPYRTGHGYITEGDDTLFTDISYKVTIDRLLDAGYLSPLISKQTELQIDVSSVGIRAGDFIHADLERLVDQPDITEDACQEIIAWAAEQGRKHWIVFCTGVKHAMRVRDVMLDFGVSCETIVGSTPKKEREQIIKDYKAGKFTCLTNANVLTTGFDAPHIDLIAFLRPTASLILYVQMAGRGMRLSPDTDKENCLVLDFAGNVSRHGPVNKVVPRQIRKGEEPGEAPTKTCHECDEIVHISVMQCPECGYQWPIPEKIDRRASVEPIMTSPQNLPKWIEVNDVRYSLHQKPGKPDSMRVDYLCNFRTISEWVCFEHEGYAKQAAKSWWLKSCDKSCFTSTPVDTIDALAQALTGILNKPAKILIDDSGKYPRIRQYSFEQTEAA